MFDIQPFHLDLVVLALTLLSIAIGFMRGFVNEVFTIVGWIAAAVATVILLPHLRGIAQSFFDSKIVADIVTAAVIFLGTLGAVTVISYSISDYLKKTRLSALDRTLGVMFGAARALIVFALAFIVIAWIWEPDNRPEFIADAKTRPIIEIVAEAILPIIPGTEDIELKAEKSAKDALDAVMRPEDQEKVLETVKDVTDKASAYTDEQREKLNDVFEQAQ